LVPGSQEAPQALAVSQQFVNLAEKARKEAEAAPSPQMPSQLEGKVLTATLKIGKPLCPEFQTDDCPNPSDTASLVPVDLSRLCLGSPFQSFYAAGLKETASRDKFSVFKSNRLEASCHFFHGLSSLAPYISVFHVTSTCFQYSIKAVFQATSTCHQRSIMSVFHVTPTCF
jgi:hypothetical protein